jgi:uncharacterized membrane protein HdeD (DUF308 family)
MQLANADPFSRPARTWWLLVTRGGAAVAFGTAALLWPGLTLIVMTLMWGAYAMLDGLLSLYHAFKLRGRGRSVALWALVGVLGISAGVLAFIWPGLSAFVLLTLIATWALVVGALQLAAAWRLRQQIKGEWLLALSGALSIVFGVLMLLQPRTAAVAVVVLVAGYSIAFGVVLMALGWRLRSTQLKRKRTAPQSTPAQAAPR